jgi:hypothetical protein
VCRYLIVVGGFLSWAASLILALYKSSFVLGRAMLAASPNIQLHALDYRNARAAAALYLENIA